MTISMENDGDRRKAIDYSKGMRIHRANRAKDKNMKESEAEVASKSKNAKKTDLLRKRI